MTIPSSRSLILWISVFSITSTSDVFGRLRTSSGIFGNDRVIFKNPSTPRVKISQLCLRKSWQVYIHTALQFPRKRYPIPDQNGQSVHWFSDQKGPKTLPFGVAHTYMTYIREYTTPPPPRHYRRNPPGFSGQKPCARII